MSRPGKPGNEATDADTLMAKPLWSIEDLSAYLGVPVASIYKWRTAGNGPCALRVGRYLRFKPADVFAWLETRRDAV